MLESEVTSAADDTVDPVAGATSGPSVESVSRSIGLVTAAEQTAYGSSSFSPLVRSVLDAERGDGASSETKSSNALLRDSTAGGDSSDTSESDRDDDCDNDTDATRVGIEH